MKKRLITAALLAATTTIPLFAPVTVTAAEDSTVRTIPETRGYLGVAIEGVAPALAAQLPDTVARGQGVMVADVAPDSPAAKAGIRPYDILVSYDDQKLFSPQQLSQLAGGDQPGHEVKLGLVRNGQLDTITVALGQKPAQVAREPRQMMPPQPGWHHRGPHFQVPGQESQTAGFWESFSALNLKKLEGNRYQASVDYLARDGSKKHHEFEGTRAEIRDQILRERDLPKGEKRQLLEALDMRGQAIMPGFWGPFDFGDVTRPWSGWPPAF